MAKGGQRVRRQRHTFCINCQREDDVMISVRAYIPEKTNAVDEFMCRTCFIKNLELGQVKKKVMKDETEFSKLQKACNMIANIRTILQEEGISSNYPERLPEYVQLTDTGKRIHLTADNILGWALGIVWQEQVDRRLR